MTTLVATVILWMFNIIGIVLALGNWFAYAIAVWSPSTPMHDVKVWSVFAQALIMSFGVLIVSTILYHL